MTTIADRMWAFKRKAAEAREYALSRYSAASLEWADEFDKAFAGFPDPDAVGELQECLTDATAKLEMAKLFSEDEKSEFLPLQTKLRGIGFDVIDTYHAALAKLEKP